MATPRVLIVPNGFKGTLSAGEAAAAIRDGFAAAIPDGHYQLFPLADGGQGSSEIIGANIGAPRVELEVIGPEGLPVTGFYFAKDGKAFVELAAASGLTLSKEPENTAAIATTFGTGQLIRHAIEGGAKEVTLFLGGSATTDGGVGFAKAVGYKFLDSAGNVMPTAVEYQQKGEPFDGERLAAIASIDAQTATEFLGGVKLAAVVDVDNPLVGKNGAAHIYGPQKGLDRAAVLELDRALGHLAEVVGKNTSEDYALVPGAGAAGGSGFGMLAFLGGELIQGPKFFLDTIDYDTRLAESDLVITGEGKVDFQSIEGKLLAEVLSRAAEKRVPVISLAGVNALSDEEIAAFPNFKSYGITTPNALTEPYKALRGLAESVARGLEF